MVPLFHQRGGSSQLLFQVLLICAQHETLGRVPGVERPATHLEILVLVETPRGVTRMFPDAVMLMKIERSGGIQITETW